MTQPPRTITVTTRRRAWLTRLTVTHPEHPPPPLPPGTPRYDPDRARELITRTATMPATKHDLKIVLTEYRHALHSLLTPTNPRSRSPAPENRRQATTRPSTAPASRMPNSK